MGSIINESEVIFEIESNFLVGKSLVLEADTLKEVYLQVILLHFETIVMLF